MAGPARQTMLQWTEQFETGNSEIDSQHKTLINYINRLEEVSYATNPSRQEAEFLVNLVDFVETYTKVHFKHEESCMARFRCPTHQENKAAHAEFLRFFQQFKRRFKTEGCRTEVLKELHDVCSAWIKSHVLRVDLRLKSYLESTPEAKTK